MLFNSKNPSELRLVFQPFVLSVFLAKVLIVLAVSLLIWFAWRHFAPYKPVADKSRLHAAERAIVEISALLRQNRGDIKRLTLVNFAGDPSDVLSDQLRSRLNNSGTFILSDRSLTDKLRILLNITQYSTDDMTEALDLAKQTGSDAVLFGTVNRFESFDDNQVLIDIEYSLISCHTGQVVYQGHYESELFQRPLFVISNLGIPNFLIWILCVLLLPIFTLRFLEVITKRESNIATGAVLALYTAIDCILAWILVSHGGGYIAIAFFIILCLIAFYYNVEIFTIALKRNTSH